MYAAPIARDADFAAFRDLARKCLSARLAPKQVAFVDAEEIPLYPPIPNVKPAEFTLPRAAVKLIERAICHRATDRFQLLYTFIHRVLHGERDLLERASDPVVARLNEYVRNVSRDIHKTHAFVRFRPRRTQTGGTVYVAWFEPQHYTLKRAAPFFAERFAQMDWVIATPIGTAIFERGSLSFGEPMEKPVDATDEVLDKIWTTYFRTTFNPARLRQRAMQREMPKLYWKNMPETADIAEMVSKAHRRVELIEALPADRAPRFAERIAARPQKTPAAPPAPLAALRAEAGACRACPLFGAATQTVFGEGPENSELIFVGEQPGDHEDIAGRPFTGPAGQLFDRALHAAGIEREKVYVTNAVKHFKYLPRGKIRLHQKPNISEVRACKPWLEREIAAIGPKLIVALGATAAQSLSGRSVSVLRERGRTAFGTYAGFITVHPSFLLRLPDAAKRDEEFENFVRDLKSVQETLAQMAQGSSARCSV